MPNLSQCLVLLLECLYLPQNLERKAVCSLFIVLSLVAQFGYYLLNLLITKLLLIKILLLAWSFG